MCRNEENTGFENVEIELSDYEFLVLAKMAHEKDVTFNQFCNTILREHISRLEAEKESSTDV